MGRKVRLSYSEYLESDVWKCPMAPVNPGIKLQVANNTGAHHWIELTEVKLRGTFCCIHCYDVKRLPVLFANAI